MGHVQLLARSFANALQDVSGLQGVAFPSGINDENLALFEFTRHVNALRSVRNDDKKMSDPRSPFAVLYLKPPVNEKPEFDIYEIEGSLAEFRCGNRLFAGASRELATFTKVIAIKVSDSFPSDEGQKGSLSLKTLAKSALVELRDAAGLSISTEYSTSAEFALHNIFKTLALTHENMGANIVNWTAIWFDHINLGLNQLLDGISRVKSSLDLQSFLSDYMYASFSLPKPKNGFDKKYSKSRQSPAAINTAIKEYWCNSMEVQMSISMLKYYPEYINLPPNEGHPISQIDWSTFDETTSDENARGSDLLAWAIHERGVDARIQRFSALTEDQFFNPRLIELGELEILDSDGGAKVHQVNGTGLHIINGNNVDLGNSQVVSPNLTVVVPLHRGVDASAIEVSGSSIGLLVDRGGDFSGNLALGSSLHFNGRIQIPTSFKTNGDYSFVPIVRLLSIQIDEPDPLFLMVSASAKASFIFVPSGAVGAMIFKVKANGKLDAPTIICQSEFEGGVWKDLENQELQIELNQAYIAVLFASQLNTNVLLNGQNVSKVENSEYLWQTVPFVTTGFDRLCIDELEITLVAEIDEVEAPESPIVAAILKNSHAKTDPKVVHRDSLRGVMEDFYLNLIDSDAWRSTLGHVVLPADRNDQVLDVVSEDGKDDFGMTNSFRTIWNDLMPNSVSVELKNSPEADAFRNSFQALEMKSRLKGVNADGTSLVWASKTSWADLANNPKLLDDYLFAYTNLVGKANSLNDYVGRFWAAYPFSLSVWNTSEVTSLASILLSPLHPIRLAWLAKIEMSLRNANNASRFCGTVEGWNFPIIGPAITANGKMVAVPCDSGKEQLFLGWSMMVSASIDEHKVLRAPGFAGNLQMPGISSSGLNANTVRYALRDFRRLHPYVSTLSIDLAARTKIPKLAEIDEAVISEFEQWVSEERISNGLVGGVRVLDSLNREGQLPTFLENLEVGKRSSPITWKRYKDDIGAVREANIRLLQDSGVAVVVNDGSPVSSGEIGEIPFRRFEIPEDNLSIRNGEVRYMPMLRETEGRGSFDTALNAIERPRGTAPSIGLQIQGNSPLLGAAQWTISGESFISPAALASLLNARRNVTQMLWEWHPPFLSEGNSLGVDSTIDKHSYFTLARIPKVLQRKLKAKLTYLLGKEADDSDVEKVFSTLGTRGVGLSALVAAGGSQLTGALGFYSVFSFDGLPGALKNNRFIMPIDVCNQFLSSLAGGQNISRDRKRADLLVIEIKENSICLTPLEIKFYGTEIAGGTARDLPNIGSAMLKSAASQAESTLKMLRAVQLEWEQSKHNLASSQDHALKANALATFVEAAMRISPHTIDPLPACKGMESIINGSTQIRLGRPLVAFFATCESVEKVKVGLDIPSDDGKIVHAEFICDPRDALQQIGGGSGAVLEKWNHALDWSLTCSEEIPINSRINDDDMRDPNDVSNSEFGRIGNGEQISEAGSNLTSDSESVSKVELDPNDDLNSLAKVVEVAIISPSSDRDTEKVIRDMGVKFSVGKLVNSPQGDDAFFWPGNTSLNQMNIGVVGDLGTGKTQLVKTLISQVCATARDAQPTPVTALILDYKKDYKDEKFIADVRGKVLRPHKIPLNIFGISGDDNQPARFRKAQAFRDVIKKIYGGVGPVQAQNLTDAIMNVYAKNDGPPTVNEVAAEYNLLVPRPDAISSILGDFVNLEIFSSDKAELKSLSELMDGSVLVLCLDELEQDTFMKNSLATLFLNQYFEYMQGLTRWPFQGSHPNQLRRLNSYLVVDEATNVMNYGFPVLMNLLLQGREFGVGVLLSSQFLSHFRVPNGENYGQPLLTWFIHKVPDISRAQLSGIGLATATEEDINKIKVLPPFSALYKSLNYSGKFIRGTPFFELRP